MRYFAEIDNLNFVLRVVEIDDSLSLDLEENHSEEIGIQHCNKTFGIGNWKETYKNGFLRKNFADSGFTYDEENDAFIPLKPFALWVLNQETFKWEPPIPMPTDSVEYSWNDIDGVWEENK